MYIACTPSSECMPNHGNNCQLRTMVFILDTSGSIGLHNFNRMTNALGNFIPLFCDNMQVAIISFSHDIKVEFCFNCHKLCPTCEDRAKIRSRVQKIHYRDGGTNTGKAT